MVWVRHTVIRWTTIAVVLLAGSATTAWTTSRASSYLGFHRSIAATTTTGLHAVRSDSNNPFFAGRLGDMASSWFRGSNNELRPSRPELDDQFNQLVSQQYSWESIRSLLESQQTASERAFRNNVAMGYGEGSPQHKVRLYHKGNTIDKVRVTFYRDSASWCPYCQKVWLALEYKQIPYTVEKINMRCYGDKPLSFQMLQPSGQIPVAIIDGLVLRQSNDILTKLDLAFADTISLAAPVEMEDRASELLRLERALFSAWMTWLTAGGSGSGQRFVQTLKVAESALVASKGPFFLGSTLSIVDVQFAPFLERMAASLAYYKGFVMRVPTPNAPTTDFPALNAWFDAMEQLPSYQLTKSDYYTHCWDLPPQIGGCVAEPAGAIFAAAIDGKERLNGSSLSLSSWELPLEPHNGGVEPDWTWANSRDEAAARREAVERLSANHEAIVAFASRGASSDRPGVPAVSAPLADPNAPPNVAVHGAVSSVLRVLCAAMLENTAPTIAVSHHEQMKSLSALVVTEGGSSFANDVVKSLAYLRDRVGVPRDMKLPAARQLRAHLNWSIKCLQEAL
jgi:glutathione S-transferase